MVLNMLATGAMGRLGRVYGNLMVNVHLKNSKLMQRGISILESTAGVDSSQARRVLRSAGDHVPVAMVMLHAAVNRADAERYLSDSKGHVRKAIAAAVQNRTEVRRNK